MTADETALANKAIVSDFLATFSRGDVAGVLQRMADDATWWVSGTIAGMSGTYEKKTFGALLQSVKTVYKTGAMQFEPKSMVAEGPFVAVEAASHADPRTTMRYDRARGSLGRHATYIVAAYIAGAAR